MGVSLGDFVPVNMELAREYGLTQASILGAMWLRSRHNDYTCTDSAGYIAEMIGLTRGGVHAAQKRMIEAGLLTDTTPERLKATHDLRLSVNVVDRLEVKEVETDNANCQPDRQTVNDVDSEELPKDEICQRRRQSVNVVAHKEKEDLNTNKIPMDGLFLIFKDVTGGLEPRDNLDKPAWEDDLIILYDTANKNLDDFRWLIGAVIDTLDDMDMIPGAPKGFTKTAPRLMAAENRNRAREATVVNPQTPDLPKPEPEKELTAEQKLLEQIKRDATGQMTQATQQQLFGPNGVYVKSDNGQVELSIRADNWHPGAKKLFNRILAGLRPGIKVNYVTG